MSENSVYLDNDQPTSQQTDCPACGSNDIQNLHPLLDPVCVVCGTVCSESANPLPDQTNEDEGVDPALSWGDYVKISNTTESRIAEALDVLEAIGNEVGLSTDIRRRAAEIYAMAAIPNLTDGRSTELVVTAAVALGKREAGESIPSNRLADLIEERPRTLTRIIRLLNRELELSIAPPRAEDYLRYLCDDLDLDLEIGEDAREILTRENLEPFNGKNPVGFASAAIYLAANQSVTQREVAASAGITGETLRVRVLDIREAQGGRFE